MDNIYSAGMPHAMREAERAFDEDEIPIGAVIIYDGKIIGKGHNQVERLKDPTAHAEIIAITAATSYLESKWLLDADLYVTKEPCSMCAGAIVHSRIKNLIFGAYDPKTGACGSILDIVRHPKLNHRVNVIGGVEEQSCAAILHEFFDKLRSKEKEQT